VPSYISSAGITGSTPGYGKTCRKNVLRGVDVPVVPGAAGRALPRSGTQAQRGEQVPAGRARLGAGVPAVSSDQVPSGPRCFVLQHPAEITPPAIRDRLRKAAIANHVPDGKVFNSDDIMVADQAGAGLVQEIRAAGAYLPVSPGDLCLCFLPVSRTLLAPGKPALIPGQVSLAPGQVPRIGDLLAVRSSSEILDAQVHADHGTRGGKLHRISHLGRERHVPAAVRVAGNRSRGRVEAGHVHVRPGPGELQGRACLGKPQCAVTPPEPGAGERGRLAPATVLKSRVPGSPGKERGIRDLLVTECLLQRDRRHLIQPREARFAFHGGQVSAGLAERGAEMLSVIPGVPPRQRPVPRNPDTPERAGEHCRLHLVRVRPALVRHPHSNVSYPISPRQVNQITERGERRFLPGLKTGVSTPRL
jgi:hypothetical protein